MKVFYSPEDFKKLTNAVVTIGTFDGVHQGHQKILNRIREAAKKSNGESVVISFWPHPRKVIKPDAPAIKLLNTIEEKIALLKKFHIDNLLLILFTQEFSNWSSEDFVKKILVDTIGTKKLIIGYDHRFGKDRGGNIDTLKADALKYHFELEEIPKQEIDEVGISSTAIRKALQEGAIETANKYLGHTYSITGKVIKGKQLGRTLGYPTANLALKEPDKLIPQDGIYTVKVQYKNQLYGGMMSIGYNPTVEGKQKTFEVNIFDFDKDIYGEEITVQFLKFLRHEEKFASLKELIAQLDLDKKNSEAVLRKV